MKYLKYFAKNSDYQNYINGDSILRPNVSYSFESKDISFNAVLPPDPRKSIIGSVYLYDKINKSYSFCTQDELTIEKYPSEQYLPVGIVVIPASHDVYGTGECGIMSLMEMDCNNPELGSSISLRLDTFGSAATCQWGRSTDLSLPNLNQVPLISTALTSNEITGVQDDGYMPTTMLTSNIPSAGNGLDTLAGYDSSYKNGTIPSPYLEDGGRNPSYYCNDGRMVSSADTDTSVALTANYLSDFDGVGNTAVITAAATAQTDWKTSSTITNSNSEGYYPAACCCYRFNPDGNSAGKWYLPAMGELGYMIARCAEIDNSLTKVQSIYGSSFACFTTGLRPYWSSSKYSSAKVCCMTLNSCYVGYFDGGSFAPSCVRAFLRA